MSDYRREQLLTYVGGPFLVLIGALLPILPLALRRPDDACYGAIAASIPIAMVFAAFGIIIFRDGRRRLASDHWRAEHFVP